LITATKEQDELLYNPETSCHCMECQTNGMEYPYEFGPVTTFTRTYLNNKQVTFITNSNCNINCRHCFCPSVPEQSKDFISKEIVNKTMDIIKGNGQFVISILGGEVMLYPEGCKYIADKSHEEGHIFRLITNGFFGKDQKMIDYLIDEIKPEILVISCDEYHQEFIPIETVKNLIDKCYGKTEIVLEACLDIKDISHGFNRNPKKLELAKKLDLKQKKIFYLVDAIVNDGNAIKNNLGYTKTTCKPGYCSACGLVVVYSGRINVKCEFNSRPILDECKAWIRNVLTDNFDYKEFIKFISTKRMWMDPELASEISLLLYSDKYKRYYIPKL
jgi:organic radical activating enzyme